MNKAIIGQLANMIESVEPDKFYMGHWFGEFDVEANEMYDAFIDQDYGTKIDMNLCGTSACIAGWTIAMMNGQYGIYFSFQETWELAAHYLGLTKSQAEKIFFYGKDSVWAEYAEDYDFNFDAWGDRGISPDQITNKKAADMLRRIASGEVEL